MQDIDFDEIDRAVNSMTSPSPAVPARVEPVSEPAPYSAVAERVGEVSSEPVVSETSPISPAVRRSSGRFMDVVHPSSDMRPLPLTRPAALSAPSFHREEAVEREAVASRPEPAAVTSTAFHWPDPIDATESAPTPQPEQVSYEVIEPSVPESTPEVVEEPLAMPVQEESIEDDDTAPLESPFLTGAKVEKRPLGAFSGADADLPLLEDPIPFSTNAAPQAEDTPALEEPAHEEHEEIPHELHETLLALDGHGQDAREMEPLLEATNPPVFITPEEGITTGPTSITQQYQEQTRSASEVSGSIFDTEAYHKALTHPAKKRSVALIIVWILALLLVGGGIGTAIYFVIRPMLV